MTYGEILGLFVVPWVALLAWSHLRLDRAGVPGRPWRVLAALCLAALIYTTPWDNYLVATGVWWYDPALVNGLTFGRVPAEEYAFFVLQTLLTSLWAALLFRRNGADVEYRRNTGTRLKAAGVATALAAAGILLLLTGWRPGTYAGLVVAWGMGPLAFQAILGADALSGRSRMLLAAALPPTAYLWAVDALALAGGTWTVDPAQTMGLALGPLPIEEMLFFLLTNGIVASGTVLLLTAAALRRQARP